MSSVRQCFIINGTDFHISSKKSRFTCKKGKSAGATIDADIHGDQSRFDKLSEADDSPWSWALYPPHFHLRSIPVTITTDGTAAGTLSASKLADYDASIYMMEHNPLEQLTISLADRTLSVKGTVHLCGETLPFTLQVTMR